MTTKDQCLPFKGKHGLCSTSNDRYNNLNLNQNHQCLSVGESVHSKDFSNKSKKARNYDPIREKNCSIAKFKDTTHDTRRNKSSISWKTSENKLASEYLNIHSDSKKDESKKGKDSKDKSKNASTLSLHIAAYENSIEAASDSFERSKNKSNFTKTLGNVTHMTLSSTISNPFEFPRQQTDESADPAIMQFSASQRLFKPNQSGSSSNAQHPNQGSVSSNENSPAVRDTQKTTVHSLATMSTQVQQPASVSHFFIKINRQSKKDMSNSSKTRKKAKQITPTLSSDVSILDDELLESSDEEGNQSTENAVPQNSKSKMGIFGKTWNGVKQFFNYAEPKALTPEKLDEKENASSVTELDQSSTATESLMETETAEGFTVTQTSKCLKAIDTAESLTITERLTAQETVKIIEKSDIYLSDSEEDDKMINSSDPEKSQSVEKFISNEHGWEGGEIMDCSKGGNPLIMEMEVSTSIPFEKMPDILRLRIIGTTINYILLEEMKGSGFITREAIEEVFKLYTGVPLNDACQSINTTFKEFVDKHFSTHFMNCHPHGLARLEVVDKPVQQNFGSFSVATAAVAPPPTIKAIEHASEPSTSAAPIIQELTSNTALLTDNLLAVENDDEEKSEGSSKKVEESLKKPPNVYPSEVVEEPVKEATAKFNESLLQTSLLDSGSSDEEEKSRPSKVVEEALKKSTLKNANESSKMPSSSCSSKVVKEPVKKSTTKSKQAILQASLLDSSEEEEESENDLKKAKESQKKPFAACPSKIVKESAKKSTAQPNHSILQPSLLVDSSEEGEKSENDSKNVEESLKKPSNSCPSKVVKKSAKKPPANSGPVFLQPSCLLSDSDEEKSENVSKNAEESFKKPSTSCRSKTDKESVKTPSVNSGPSLLQPSLLVESSEEGEKSEIDSKNAEESSKKPSNSCPSKDAKESSKEPPANSGSLFLQPSCLLSESDEEKSENDAKNVKETLKKASTLRPSKVVKEVENIHLLNEKFVRPSDSESDSEQFVNLEHDAKEIYDLKSNKKHLDNTEEDEEKSSTESDEVTSSEDEGPSSLESSDDEEIQPNGTKYLEDDMFDLLSNQVAEDFSKKSAADKNKAKEEKAKKNAEKLQKLDKKKEEYGKLKTTAKGVIRLENSYMDKVIFDPQTAKIQEPPQRTSFVSAEVAKSKSQIEVEQKSKKEAEKPKPVEVKKEKSKSPAAEPSKIVAAAKDKNTMPKVNGIQKQPSLEAKKGSEKPKEAKVSYIGKYDPDIPIANEEFLEQSICSEDVIGVKKAGPLVVRKDPTNNLPPATAATTDKSSSSISFIPVTADRFLDEMNDELPREEAVQMVEDDVLEKIYSDDRVALKKQIPIMDDEELFDRIGDSTVNVRIIDDDFLDGVLEVEVNNSVPLVDDGFLDMVSEVKHSIPIVADNFLDEVGVAERSVPMVADNFLDELSVPERSVPVVGDDFLDAVSSDAKNSVPIIDDNFLDEVGIPKKSAQMVDDGFLDAVLSDAKKPVPVVADNFLDEVGVSGKSARMVDDNFLDSVPEGSVPVVGDDFLDVVSSDAKKSVPMVTDNFLDEVGVPEKSVPMVTDNFLDEVGVPKKSAQMVDDDFLDAVSSDAKKSVPMVTDNFLDEVGVPEKSVPMVTDNFLDEVGVPERSVPVVTDNFLDELSVPERSVPVVGDDFLDAVSSDAKKSVPLVTDNFLDEVGVPDKSVPIVGDGFLDAVPDTKKHVPTKNSAAVVVDDNFLDMVGLSNDTVKTSSAPSFSSAAANHVEPKPSTSIKVSSMILPGPFKPVVILHKSTNIPIFQDDSLAKMISTAEIGLNYDSDSSENASLETSTNQFAPLEYKLDSYLNIPNFAVVHEMKNKIAKSLPEPKFSHLLNFWLEYVNGFSDLVVFFQYFQYHVEQFKLTHGLSFKKYRNLIDAIVNRELVFKKIVELVTNVPLMCQFKFLIFDDNDPEYIYVNPELLGLQMIPLADGLPTSLMHLFSKKRQWLISDLKKEFQDFSVEEFYRQLCNFLNDRPDLVMLKSPKLKATFPEMSIVLNDRVGLKLCCYKFALKDLHVAEHLHLRMDHINSMKQFIPQRSHQLR